MIGNHRLFDESVIPTYVTGSERRGRKKSIFLSICLYKSLKGIEEDEGVRGARTPTLVLSPACNSKESKYHPRLVGSLPHSGNLR